jgi:hypothetical protein
MRAYGVVGQVQHRGQIVDRLSRATQQPYDLSAG